MIFVHLLMAFSVAIAGGGNEVGNGGDVVICKSSVRFFDYFESEMLKQGDLQFAKEKDPFLKAGALLNRLKKLSPRLENQYRGVLSTLKKRVQFLDHADFRDVKDSFEVAVPAGCEIKQIAIQQDDLGKRMIRISKKLWDQLNADDQAGLLLHEIIYEHFAALGETNSVKARRFNSYLASSAISKVSPADFQKFLVSFKLSLY